MEGCGIDVGMLMAWEEGKLSDEEEAILFQKLINNGWAWTLQGTYGRNANRLIDAGLCHLEGELE